MAWFIIYPEPYEVMEEWDAYRHEWGIWRDDEYVHGGEG